jgi:hypothetical protein
MLSSASCTVPPRTSRFGQPKHLGSSVSGFGLGGSGSGSGDVIGGGGGGAGTVTVIVTLGGGGGGAVTVIIGVMGDPAPAPLGVSCPDPGPEVGRTSKSGCGVVVAVWVCGGWHQWSYSPGFNAPRPYWLSSPPDCNERLLMNKVVLN